VTLPISSEVTLYAHQPGLYFRTTVDNRARDHRLRALFPTPHRPRVAHADEHFVVLAREIDLPSGEGWVEGPTPTQHQLAFVDVSDRAGGLALLNRGLPEYEARREGDGAVTLCLTLLRCVGVLGRGALLTRRSAGAHIPIPTPDAQCPGRHVFEYTLLSHEGGWRAAYPTAYAYNGPMCAVRVGRHPGAYPPAHSFIALDPAQFVLSSVKGSEGGEGLIIRGYNVTGEPLEATLRLGFPVRAVYRTHLNEERVEALRGSGRDVGLSVGPHAVVTLEIVPAGG